MATGPEHYAAAQTLIHNSHGITADDLEPAQLLMAVLVEAQARATLALAAATALRVEYPEYTRGDDSGWTAVAGDTITRNTNLVWWLDDSGESPEPELYASYNDAATIGRKQWTDANPTTTVRMWGWHEVEDSDPPDGVGLGDMQLVVNDQETGIFVRPRRPKTFPPGVAV